MDEFEEFVIKVKNANPLEDVIDGSGAEYKLQRKRGNYLRGETHDSLVVRVDEQYYVWNDRGEKGDVFNWLEARRKWDFWNSLQWLAERAKIELPRRFVQKEDQPARLAGRMREDAYGIAQRVMAGWLLKDEAALGYVRSRGWTDETIKEAGLGFSGRNTATEIQEMSGEFAMHGVEKECANWTAILGHKGDVKSWGRKYMVDVQANWVEWGMVPGLMGKTRLVYPHYLGGRVRYLSARNILGAEINTEGREIKSYNLPGALAGPRQAFYNHAYGRRAEECALVEGQADAVTLGQWGIAAVAMAGASWDDHAGLLAELRKRHATLYIGLDNDEAGMAALVGREHDWPIWRQVGPMARVVRWGGGE